VCVCVCLPVHVYVCLCVKFVFLGIQGLYGALLLLACTIGGIGFCIGGLWMICSECFKGIQDSQGTYRPVNDEMDIESPTNTDGDTTGGHITSDLPDTVLMGVFRYANAWRRCRYAAHGAAVKYLYITMCVCV